MTKRASRSPKFTRFSTSSTPEKAPPASSSRTSNFIGTWTTWWPNSTSTVDKINAGQGTLGQLAVNPQLYDALTSATLEFQSLAKDMHANPKRFLSIRLGLF
jgi:hypothetical protein